MTRKPAKRAAARTASVRRRVKHPAVARNQTTQPVAKPSGNAGTLTRIAGPVVVATGLSAVMYEVVLVGKERLLGEVIQLQGERTVIQVYEDTSGLAPGAPVEGTGKPLSVTLGPGLLSTIYDGIQRPLTALRAGGGDFITRGARLPGLDEKRRWKFTPASGIKDKTAVTGGMIIGTVEEFPGRTHRILVPPTLTGTVSGIRAGEFTILDTIGTLTTADKRTVPLRLAHEWPVRIPRPVKEKVMPDVPLITGQRVIDTLFPVAKGGTAIIPGPFGSCKTVTQQSLSKWCDADIIVYVGCGERGNEMTEVLTTFPKLKDPRSGRPLMERTILIANTSNMPVAAREASVYTGVTIAEYYRDQGYDVALMADSTSRWAEAMREIGSRLEEMPGEEGFPAYLASRVAEFYERACVARPLSNPDSRASLTIIGAVSPPGGDIFEPVSQASLRVAKVFWALDAALAQQRHFPSINWLESYSLAVETLYPWFVANVTPEWPALTRRAGTVLQEEASLREIVQLVGSDALPEGQQATLHVARLLREIVLQQSAYDERDAFTHPSQTALVLRAILAYLDAAQGATARGVRFTDIERLGLWSRLFAIKSTVDEASAKAVMGEIAQRIGALGKTDDAAPATGGTGR